MAENTLERSAQILVVEDETEIRELISLLLLRSGYQVSQCESGVEALEKLKSHAFDLMVLDWMLPYMSGIDLLRSLPPGRKEKMPVLMVTAKAEPLDVVQGLESGADDYVTKPFEPAVFTARVKALLRRKALLPVEGTAQEVLTIADLSINLASYEVKCKGELLHLTPSEFKLLSTLAVNRGRVLTRDHLVEQVQGEGISVTGRTIDTHVFGLRKKLGDHSDWIETIRGVGYRVRAE